MCLKKSNTLLKWLPNKKVYGSGEKGLGVWIANGLNFHMTPKSPKVIDDRVNTAHFCEGLKIRLRRNQPFPL